MQIQEGICPDQNRRVRGSRQGAKDDKRADGGCGSNAELSRQRPPAVPEEVQEAVQEYVRVNDELAGEWNCFHMEFQYYMKYTYSEYQDFKSQVLKEFQTAPSQRYQLNEEKFDVPQYAQLLNAVNNSKKNRSKIIFNYKRELDSPTPEIPQFFQEKDE